MPYNPNIPQPNDTLDVSQGDILGNFLSANTSFGINHYSFSDLTANNGKHKFVNITNFTPSGTVPSNISGEGVIYTDVTGTPSHTQLFYNRDTEGIGRRVQLTAGTLSGTNNTSFGENNNNGWTFLPGNLLLQYGNFNPNISTTVTFPIPFKAATTPFNIQLTGSQPNNSTFRTSVLRSSVTNTQFVFAGSVDADWGPIYWLAIGIAE